MISIKTSTMEFVSLLTKVVSNVFPQAAVAGTKLPFIIYRRNTISNRNSKDSVYQSDISFDIDIVTESYIDGLDYLDSLLDNLQRVAIDNPTYNYRITIDSVADMFDEQQELFIQRVGCTLQVSR